MPKPYTIIGPPRWRIGKQSGLVVRFAIRTAAGLEVKMSLRNKLARAPFTIEQGPWTVDLQTPLRGDRQRGRKLIAALYVANDSDLVPTLLAAVEDERINV
jgi:hypothetical protein